MNPKTRKSSHKQLNNNSQILYQAYGVLRGRLIWSNEQLTSLILQDETIITINNCKPNLLPWLTRRRAQLETEPNFWGVYPRQDTAIGLHITLATQTLTAPSLVQDEFVISGRIAAPPDGHHVMVEIYRNRLPRQHSNRAHEIISSFYLNIQGNLQSAHVGQIWQLSCVRIGLNICLQQANCIQTSDIYSPDFTEFHPAIEPAPSNKQ